MSLTVGSESYIYEQEAIETWLKEHNTNPLTGEELVDKKTFSVTILRNLISSYLAQNPLLWESEEIYFSLKLAEQFASAIVENDIVSVRRYLALDPRLISNPLKLEKTALMLACEYSTLEILSLILQGIKDKPKNPIEYNTDTSLSLLYSVSSNLKLPGVRLLNEALMWREADYQQFFMQAVKDRRLDVVDNILSLGVNPNMLLANGTTLLEYAVNEQLVSLIEVLVKHNVALTVQDYKGNNLLHQAIIKHHNLLALWFIENVKLSLNSQNKQGQSALHLAIENSQNDIIQALLKHGNIDINQADAQDNTVLHLAVAKGDQALALLLVEKDASIKCKNKNQETAIDLASKLGYHQLAVNLKQYHQRHKIAFLLKPLEDKIADQEKQLLLQQQELLRLQVKELEITTLQKKLASLKDENQNFKKHINFWLQDKARQDPAVLVDEIPAKHQAPIKLMAKVADDMVITVAKDNHIILWELKNNILKAKVDFSQYKEYLTYSEIVAIQPIPQDNILLVYNTAVFETLNLKTKLFTYKRPQSGAADNFSTIYSFVMLPENRALIGSSRYEMLLIDLTTLEVLDVITTKNWVPDTLLLLSNGRLASGAKEKVVKIWDIQMGTNIDTFLDNIPIALRKEITSLCELPNNLLATGHTDNLVKIWNLKTGKCLKTFNEIASTNVNFFNNNNQKFNFNFAVTKITCLQLTLNGKILICGSSNGSIMGWELATGNRLQCLSGHSASVNSIIALSNHEFITCSDDQNIKVWKVANNNIELNHAEEVQTSDRANECKIS